MSHALNYRNEDKLANRLEFQNWLGSNLRETRFSDVQEGLNLYDASMIDSEILHTRFSSFYDEIEILNPTDIHFIFEPSFGVPDYETTADPHAEYCMDVCENSLDDLEEEYCTNNLNDYITQFIIDV